MAIFIDLRRDLPKALAVEDELVENVGQCFYSTPCVVGSMMSERARSILAAEDLDQTGIGELIFDRRVRVPRGQHQDLQRLQDAFDGRQQAALRELLREMAGKYLSDRDGSPEGRGAQRLDGEAATARTSEGGIAND